MWVKAEEMKKVAPLIWVSQVLESKKGTQSVSRLADNESISVFTHKSSMFLEHSFLHSGMSWE